MANDENDPVAKFRRLGQNTRFPRKFETNSTDLGYCTLKHATCRFVEGESMVMVGKDESQNKAKYMHEEHLCVVALTSMERGTQFFPLASYLLV